MEKEYKFHFRFISTGEIIEQNVKFNFDGVKVSDQIKAVNRRFGYFKRSILHFENKWRKKVGFLPVDRDEYVTCCKEVL